MKKTLALALLTAAAAIAILAQDNGDNSRGCGLTAQPTPGTTILGMTALDHTGGITTWVPGYPLPIDTSHATVTVTFNPRYIRSGGTLLTFTCSNNVYTATVPLVCGILETNDDGSIAMDFTTDVDCKNCKLTVNASPCTVQVMGGSTNNPPPQ